VLRLNVLSGATGPVLTLLGEVTVLKFFISFIGCWWVRVQLSRSKLRLALCHLNIEVGGLIAGLGNYTVNVTGSASIDFILARDEACVTGQILFIV
jgi:hypothetical protein